MIKIVFSSVFLILFFLIPDQVSATINTSTDPVPLVRPKKITVIRTSGERLKGFLVKTDEEHVYLVKDKALAVPALYNDCKSCLKISKKDIKKFKGKVWRTVFGIFGILFFVGISPSIGWYNSDDDIPTGTIVSVFILVAVVTILVPYIFGDILDSATSTSKNKEEFFLSLKTKSTEYLVRKNELKHLDKQTLQLTLIQEGLFNPLKRMKIILKNDTKYIGYIIGMNVSFLYGVNKKKLILQNYYNPENAPIKIPVNEVQKIRSQ